ncbi:MAG: serine hydroxymethyltransferase [Desulfarculus sp.]|nr:serine hydroxymethyltransferase [Pseudomonadota bacterium]MBV1716726.1 serine hydroxymethyltransferase [Desulfarculus sp.]MBU4573382.1 serine hydroxymethyltransferase [Pseudomonadota bacterium]MBU4596502.1 serine hydroxymethyltransferase [Pseudomonadota bacterium]MBV1738997.1 serine hydroxymethyltransferase [Desulfarculus sp.]
MDPLHSTDPEIAALIDKEAMRQASVLRMIPSENYASPAVLAATGSILCNKYSEGYPAKRYYQGQENIDEVEMLAISRAKALFGAEHANVQPYSGSPANMAVYLGLLGKGGRVLGMDLAAGGHLTHGAKASFSGTFYDVASYGLSREDGRIDYAQARRLAQEFKPQMIFCGASSYPRVVDFAAFAEIADEAGARLVADVSHISGLCVTGQHPSPFPHADVVTTTTHKLLRGPRGGMVLCRQELAKAIDKAVFPGLQGGPHNQTTAAIAVALKEAATPAYADYCRQVVVNSKALAEGLLERGFTLVTGGTDNHLVLIDAGASGLTGKAMATALERAGIVANANKIPFDPRSANDPSGVRMGTPALTTRGMGTAEMDLIAGLVAQAAANIEDEGALANIRELVADLCVDFPAPGIAPGQC